MHVLRIRSMRTSLMAVLAAFVLMFASAPAPAQDTIAFDIPAQPLSTALSEFASQSGQQLLYTPDVTEGRTSSAVQGELAPGDALRQLLAGTEQGFAYTPSGAVLVGDPSEIQRRAARMDGAGLQSGGQNTIGQRRPGIEEIIVTGQKREERIQDVPIAISAFSQEDLTTHQIAGGPDLITQIPNFSFTKTNFTGYSIQIRGIGTQAISATTDPAVAVALNQTPFIRNRFFEQEFYDMERVEVLRGPQGTLFGRNATAGVVNLITAKPKFEPESMFSIDMGNYNSSRIEGMVNIPLVEDKAALRLAGAWTRRDGYATNELTGDAIDGRDLWSTRATLRFTPNDNLDINLLWEHFEENDDRLRSGKQLCKKDVVTEIAGRPVDFLQTLPEYGQSSTWSGAQGSFSQGCERNSLYAEDSFQTPNGLMLPYYGPLAALGLPTNLNSPYASDTQSQDLRVIESTINPEYRAKTDIAQLQVKLQLTDGLTLDSETAYSDDTVYSLQDFNRFNSAPGAWRQNDEWRGGTGREGVIREGPNGGIFCDPQLGCSDRLVAADISTAESEQFSQEFRLASEFDGPLNFSLGANYLRFDVEDKYYVFINSLSLIAAGGPDTSNASPPYVPGETTNIDCLLNGYEPGHPGEIYNVASCTYMDPNPIGSVNDQGRNYFLSRNPYNLRSYAVFGEAYWNLTDNLKLTAGLRWSVDRKEAPRIPTWLLTSENAGEYPVAEVIEQTWREPTGRLVLDWQPNLTFTDETLLYGSYSRGYKAGGTNPPNFTIASRGQLETAAGVAAQSATRPTVFEAEFVDAFEIGTKNTLLDGDLTVNLAAFYYDYQGYQVSEIVDRSAFNRNFDAEVWGGEIETDWWALQNLRLSFKGGYQMTRIGDGQSVIDLMDRTAGDPDWTLHRPFPTYASSCILPTYLFEGFDPDTGEPIAVNVGGKGGGNIGGCELAYIAGVDPVTTEPYVPNPTSGRVPFNYLQDYPGFDPSTAPNNGEGIAKDIGGNELPNSPNYTATISGDYIIPLSNDWSLTLHTDLHWQSESWWRVFNDHEYNRLDDYFTMNLAAIAESVDGWHVMAYIKNVTDETAITGAFLNSDDTGLTTNVFLTEPRLFGLRVTRHFSGGGGNAFLGGLVGGSHEPGRPYPLTVELGGQSLSYEAPNEQLRPGFAGAFGPPLDDVGRPQDSDLGSGTGAEIALTYRPNNGPWSISAGIRRAGISDDNDYGIGQETEPVCVLGGSFAVFCNPSVPAPFRAFEILRAYSQQNRLDTWVDESEKSRFVDLAVGRDAVFGGLSRSVFGVGLRHGRFRSSTSAEIHGTPDWNIIEGAISSGSDVFSNKITATRTLYQSWLEARREFEGMGPVASWEAAYPLLGGADAGRVDLDWSLTAGVLLGERETTASSTEKEGFYEVGITELDTNGDRQPVTSSESTVSYRRDSGNMEAVPLLDVSLGLSYTLDRVRISTGYRWERYYGVLDGGFEEEEGVDRTLEGVYLNLSLGFGH